MTDAWWDSFESEGESATKDCGIPPADEQVKQIKELEASADLMHCTKAYAIDTYWLNDWKRATGQVTGRYVTSSSVGQIDNSYLVNQQGLLKPEMAGEAVAVPASVWKQLHEWYGGGPVVPVDTAWDSLSQKLVIKVIVTYVGVYNDKSETIKIRDSATVKELKEQVMKAFDVPLDRETRLIDWYADKFYAVLDDDSKISACNLHAGQKIRLDEKGADGKWKCQKEDYVTTSSNYGNGGSYGSNYNRSSAYGYSSYQGGYSYSQGGYWYSRSYPWVGPGKVGFSNLGNTCFFNSGVQCLMHTMSLMNVFLNTDWEADLNVTNPLGSRGLVTKAFAELVRDVWQGSSGVVQPSALKSEIGIFRDQFAGWGQQDSHELIMAVLDAIHEDLNRCKVKPQVESVYGDSTNDLETAEQAWHNHKLRNDSVIVDRFYGLLRSTLYCPECRATTVVFDPYSSIALPLQKKQLQKVKALFVPLDPKAPKANLVLMLPPIPKKEDVSKAVSELLGRDVNAVLGLCSTYGLMDWNSAGSDTTYSYSKDFYVFEVDDTSKFWVPCVLMMKMWNTWKTYANDEPFYGPFLLPFDSDDVSEEQIEEKAAEYLSWMWRPGGGATEQREWNDYDRENIEEVGSDYWDVGSPSTPATEALDVITPPASSDAMHASPIQSSDHSSESSSSDAANGGTPTIEALDGTPLPASSDAMHASPIQSSDHSTEASSSDAANGGTPETEALDVITPPASSDAMHASPVQSSDHSSESNSSDAANGGTPEAKPVTGTFSSENPYSMPPGDGWMRLNDQASSSDEDEQNSTSNEAFGLGYNEIDDQDKDNIALSPVEPLKPTQSADDSTDSTDSSSSSSSSYVTGYTYNTPQAEGVFDDDNTGLTTQAIALKERLVAPKWSDGERRLHATVCKTYSEHTATLKRAKNLEFMADRFVKLDLSRDYVTKASGFDVNALLTKGLEDPVTYESATEQGGGVTLDKCFQFFAASEVLDDDNQWFCPKCRQFVCATKKLDIWSVPDIMIVQLKRFITGTWTTKKLDVNVDYPDELDMSPYVVGPAGQSLRYKFYAVSEHMGSLAGGHYIAHAAVQDTSGGEEWYQFNDSSASPSSRASAHTDLAYVLFYVREGSRDSVMSQWERPLAPTAAEAAAEVEDMVTYI